MNVVVVFRSFTRVSASQLLSVGIACEHDASSCCRIGDRLRVIGAFVATDDRRTRLDVGDRRDEDREHERTQREARCDAGAKAET